MENITTSSPDSVESAAKSTFRYFPFFNRRQASFVLFFIALVFYAPSYYNEYALDDGIIIHQNEFVLKGVRGIKGILSKDLYHSFYRRMNAHDQLQGGRYRPVSVISYALEQQLIGPYRTGYYMHTEDANKNGVLDEQEVSATNFAGENEATYEYNDYVDKNGDHVAQPDECYYCWDLNKNFKNDPSEDLNADGVFNEIDCQVYGAGLRHFNNIWLYALACVLVYLLFSKYLFKNYEDLAFLAALIFMIHPVHSEVVANVRGRDDIFSLLFIVLTFIFSFRYLEKKNTGSLVVCALMFLLALLSKEYAVLLFLFIPLVYFVFENIQWRLKQNLVPLLLFLLTGAAMIVMDIKSWYFSMPDWVVLFSIALTYIVVNLVAFRSYFTEKRNGALMIGLYMAGTIYLALRLNAVNMAPGIPDTEILNNPFLLASDSEAFATKVYTLLVDLKLMFFPHPLVADYSYASIAYRKLGDWDFLLSLFIYLTLLGVGLRLTIKRHLLGFAMLFYFAFLVAVSNLTMPTGTVMLESYLFHASLGMAIIIAWLMLKLLDALQGSMVTKRSVLLTILLLAVLFAGMKCWERSKDWKNDVTLFLKDVKNQPNSVLVLGNAGARWIDLADTKEITGIVLPGEDSTKFNDYNGTLNITEKEVADSGYASKREAALRRGIAYLKHAVVLHPRYVNGFLNLGLAYFKLQQEVEAIKYWKYAEQLYPSNPYLNNYYEVFGSMLMQRGAAAFNDGNYKLAMEEYQKWTIIKPSDAESWYSLGGAYYNLKYYAAAQTCWQKALIINPNYEEVRKVLNLKPSDGKIEKVKGTASASGKKGC
ncbi:MAG: tetratricopeptide repeat protein [bacterium]|nr:tetratricopeptide repeat protein [bacterium]